MSAGCAFTLACVARCCGLLVLLLAAVAAGFSSPGPGLAASRNACTITQGKSLEGKVRTDIRFVNKSSGAVDVVWLDYTGKRVHYNTLPAGASYSQPTWKTHSWLVLDASGRCIGYVVAPAAEYVIEDSTGAGAAAPAAKKPTFTAVVCTIAVGAGSSTCTAQVADASPVRGNPPTGTVRLSAAKGIVGSSCTLAGTPGSPGIASCTVSYTPPLDLVAGEPPPVSADYAGDATFEASSGGSGYTPASVVVAGDVTVSIDGAIPTTLANANPFPVSADELLTVSGTIHGVMLRAGATAPKPKVIGRTTVRLAPFGAAAAKVKLTAAGRALLGRHKVLHATLSVTTRAAGKPTKTATRRVTIKAA